MIGINFIGLKNSISKKKRSKTSQGFEAINQGASTTYVYKGTEWQSGKFRGTSRNIKGKLKKTNRKGNLLHLEFVTFARGKHGFRCSSNRG
jgi:hypothetical protein